MDEWRAMRASLARVRADWRRGRVEGYPRCCIAMFCWDSLWSLPPSLTRVVGQGVEPADSSCEWVPCGVFHHGGSPLSLSERIGQIALYWWHARGGLDPPWRVREEVRGHTPTPGPLEEAWSELDARVRDPDLDWI